MTDSIGRASARPIIVLAARLPGEKPLRLARKTTSPVLVDPLDYWRALNEAWQASATLINVEHDMECSDPLVNDLLACPHPLCAHAYLLHEPTTGHPEPRFAQRAGPNAATCGRWISAGEEWCDLSGLGLVKIAPEARAVPSLEPTHWLTLDATVSASVRGRWHVHWPAIEHYHR